jgi:GT2 family glycosyltransferase
MGGDVAGAAGPMSPPDLSVVVLAWDNLHHTRAFVDSVRANTDVSYELIVIDNGSRPDAADYAKAVADRSVLNSENRGFAPGMNQGLESARGEYIAFCNNDCLVPPSWASRLVATARAHPRAGIVVPAITAASNPVTVRDEPGADIAVLDSFSAPPAAVVYVMRRETMLALGGWEEEYEIASGEDVDLCFKVWVNDLDVVFDERVLVAHVGHATASRLDDWPQLWAVNRRRFLAKWMGRTDPARLTSCEPDRFVRNRATARAVAGWMDKYFTIRDRQLEQARARERSAVRSPRTRSRRAISGSLRRLRGVFSVDRADPARPADGQPSV